MDKILIAFVILCIAFIALAVDYYIKSMSRKFMSWIALRDMKRHLFITSISDEIYSIQNNLSFLDERAMINIDERKNISEILETFRVEMMRYYFSDDYSLPPKWNKMNERDYFMCYLGTYLEEHECDYEFCGHEMHDSVVEGSTFGAMTYRLSDFAVSFLKLYYLSSLYCKEHKVSVCKCYGMEGTLENIIKKEMTIVRD